VIGTGYFGPLKESAYRRDRNRKAGLMQRRLVLLGGAAYAIASLWMSFRIGADIDFATASLTLLGVTLALYGMTYINGVGVRFEIIPILMAAIFAGHIAMWALAVPNAAAAVRFAFLLSVLGIFLVIVTPTLRSALAALAAAAITGGAGVVFFLPARGVPFAAVEAFSYWLPVLAMTVATAVGLESSRREAFSLRGELERRATSDDLTGVSNRAHINLLAQNEFARARRYGEPCACLMIEIDGYDKLVETWGVHAADVVVQVFTGYCVVVMRHCDSFGRLSPSRFLALLPETKGPGALTLASRMCADLAGLDVMVDGNAVRFTVSIGATALHATDRWAGDLLRRAEQGLDDAIERGRSIAVFATPPAPPPYDDTALEDQIERI